MISDKTKAVGGDQTAFTKTISNNNEHIIKQAIVESNSIGNSKLEFSATSPQEIWKQSNPTSENHLYLKIKKVKPHGIRQIGNELIIPMHDGNDTLQNLQRIFPNGKKLFLPNRSTKGCFYILGDPKLSSIIYIAEGYATAATIHEATNQCTVVAFSVNNLPAVAEATKWKYTDKEIIICADNDAYNGNEKNFGVDKATEAAIAIDAKVAIPHFKDIPAGAKPTDFNDLGKSKGIDEVRRQLACAAKTKMDSSDIKETQDETIKRLASMRPIEYGRVRKQEAKRLNTSVGFLDRAIKDYKEKLVSVNRDNESELVAGIKPCDHPGSVSRTVSF